MATSRSPRGAIDAELPQSKYHSDPRLFWSQLSRFFAFYEPSQLRVLDKWLKNWKGRYPELMQRLIIHHGPEPTISTPMSARLMATDQVTLIRDECRHLLQQVFLLYAPERYAEVDDVLVRWSGMEHLLLDRLKTQAALRDYVYKFFVEQRSNNVQEVPNLLREWFGQEGALVELLRLRGNAKCQLPPPSVSQASTDMQVPIPTQMNDWRTQLLNLYRVFNPEKMSEVDVILKMYEGRETALFSALHRKYLGRADLDIKRPSWSTGVLNPTQPMDDNSKKKIRVLCASWFPDGAADVNELLEDFEGSELDLMRELTALKASKETERWKASEESAGEKNESKTGSATASSRLLLTCDMTCQTEDSIVNTIELLEEDLFKAGKVNPVWPSPAFSLLPEAPQAVSTDPLPQAMAPRNQLSVWMYEHELERYYGVFVNNELDLATIPFLTTVDLRKMGIEDKSEQAQILQACKELPSA